MSYFNLSLTWRLILATVSGLAAVPATKLAKVLAEQLPLPGQPVSSWGTPSASSYWEYVLIGSIFGALVMVPFITTAQGRLYKAVGLIISSILIYAFAVELVYEQYSHFYLAEFLVELAVSGTLGALLVALAVVVIAPIRASRLLWSYAAVAGLIGGLVFFGALQAEAWELDVIFLGYLSWQLLVFAALYVGSKSRNDI
jgi:hypothetical protein